VKLSAVEVGAERGELERAVGEVGVDVTHTVGGIIGPGVVEPVGPMPTSVAGRR